jgi:hypothetical protein
MMKKGDVFDEVDDDDEVRTSVTPKHLAATLSTEEFFLWTQYTVYRSPLISPERCGEKGQNIDGRSNKSRQSTQHM